MTKYPWSAMLLIVPFVIVGAQAQTTVDVTKITCDQFLRLAVASPDTIAIWLNGYYHGVQHKAVVDVQQLKSQSQDMMSYCLYNGKGGTVPVMEAAEQVLTQSK
jgi:acid stress chaperone HdeB